VNCARWDLCGGRPVMGAPTAINTAARIVDAGQLPKSRQRAVAPRHVTVTPNVSFRRRVVKELVVPNPGEPHEICKIGLKSINRVLKRNENVRVEEKPH